jgi:phosphoribosyl-AMP cyclohydrolase
MNILTKSILVLHRQKNDSFRMKLDLHTSESSSELIDQTLLNSEGMIFKDCDDDAFIIVKDDLQQIDATSLIWRQTDPSSDPNLITDIISKAPDLFPIISFDRNGNPLMFAWGKPETIEQSLSSGLGTYYSRSRDKKWIKGEESGHIQKLIEVHICLEPFYMIYIADQTGAACHTGYYSCFFRQILNDHQLLFVYKDKLGQK